MPIFKVALKQFQNEVNLVDQIENADLVITGEGEVNESSFDGKVVGEVLKLSKLMSTPSLIIAGSIDLKCETSCSFVFA